MYLIFKLTVVILILYLKLNCLDAIPLIDRHKSSLSVSALFTKANDNGGSNTITKNRNNDNNSPVSAPITTTITPLTTTITTITEIENELAVNPLMEPAALEKTPTINQKTTKRQKFIPVNPTNRPEIATTTKYVTSNRHNNNNNNHNNYYNYNVSDGSANPLQSHSNNVVVIPTAIPAIPAINDEVRTTLKIPILPGTGNSNNNNNNNDANAKFPSNNDASEDFGENEFDLGVSNLLLNTLNNTDVDQFLLKYDSDDGNTCLLDAIKDNLIWWSNKNGTLRSEALLNVTTRHSFLDLSYRNITQDDHLYSKTRAHLFVNGRDLVAFSAAQNNLTHAPYRTLSLMNATLRYLTLKGNQFAAYTAEMQKDVLSRFINDSNRHPDTTTNSSIDTKTTTKNIDDYDYEINDEDDEDELATTPSIDETLNYDGEGPEYQSTRRKFKKYKNKLLGTTDEGIAWATFPPMPNLIELDISNCHIEFVTRDAFQNLTNLRRLFIAHNKMLTIPFDTFQHIQSLQYLDLSFTNVLDSDYQIPLPTLEAIINLIYGVKIHQTTFRHLPELVYLDLSHTKLTRNSAVAFTHLGEKLRYMSLCYTAFPMVGNALFKNTALVGLDLSGNPYAAYNIIEDAFEGVADTLKYLYFERSNIKDLTWLKYLSNLRVLGLSGNNINSVSLEVFSPLSSLQILDLSSNHIGNWYNRAFTHNEQLRVLNMRDNNINIITSEMLRDFQLLDYLGLGDNNFVCDCLLRDLMDIAAANNKEAECSRNVLQDAQDLLNENAYLVSEYVSPNVTLFAKRGYVSLRPAMKLNREKSTISIDLTQLAMQRYLPGLDHSYRNLKVRKQRPKIRYVSQFYRVLKSETITPTQCPDPEPIIVHEKLNSSTLKFQLLDYEDEHYWCFNETERLHFMQLNCQPRTYVEEITEKLHTLTKYVVGSVCAVLGVSLLGVLLYLKRWHIHYYFSYLKSAALVSVAAKDAADQFNALTESDPNLVYDIFISYCQSDRQWVLEELLPNVEESGDISICMHERDFQIGLTILDNIVSCMDRSRALMLIISTNFLLSHWCQFEMHLAQHRIFEVSKEHLILVFLEDIPRSKRPKTLQYLMEVKTYIKWPSAGKNHDRTPSADERKFFWKRLKRSLENIGLNPYPRARESHA